MVAKVCLFTCALTIGQLVDRTGWLLLPRLGRGQELVYLGTFQQEPIGAGIHPLRKYILKTRMLVLDAKPKHWEVAVLTCLRNGGRKTENQDDPLAGIAFVRLELGNLDKQGTLTHADGSSMTIPLEEPPTLETGFLVSVPRIRLSKEHFWLVPDPGRPKMRWQILGTELVGGTKCVKIRGVQQSPDWKKPRGDHTAWNRTEYVWIEPRSGIAAKVVREVLFRDPARDQPTKKITVRYELDSQFAYPGRLFEHRRQEALHAGKFDAEAEKYLPQATSNKKRLTALTQRMGQYFETRPPTPYRKAIFHLQQRIQKALRGEIVIRSTKKLFPKRPERQLAEVGQRVPNFLVTDLAKRKPFQLYRNLGKPLLLVFYNPKTPNGKRVLNFAKRVHEKYKSRVTVMGLSMTEDREALLAQHKELELPFRIYSGKGLHETFRVDATPHMVVLDSNGIMRAGYTGWGFQIPSEIFEELSRCFPKRPKSE